MFATPVFATHFSVCCCVLFRLSLPHDRQRNPVRRQPDLKSEDKLFQSPFNSDVYFFSTRQQLDRRWGTTQPVTIRDKDFGAVRLPAFGNYAYGINDAVAQSGVPFVDLAANQVAFAKQLQVATAAEFTRLGLVLQAVNVQNPRLSEDLQKVLDQKIGVGMVGDAIGLGAGVALRQPQPQRPWG